MSEVAQRRKIRMSTDADPEGVEIEIEPYAQGGWISVEEGFHGVRPGPPSGVQIDGELAFVQRRAAKLFFPPE